MNCRRLHDSLHDLFGDVDSKGYHAAVKAALQHEDWSPLLGTDAGRDQALLHAAECDDCLDDILAYLEIRDTVDYRQFPCLHLAYYSTIEEVRCIENDHGFFSVILHEKESVAVGIGFCPWCGVVFPTSYAEMDEAEKLGMISWQQRQMRT